MLDLARRWMILPAILVTVMSLVITAQAAAVTTPAAVLGVSAASTSSADVKARVIQTATATYELDSRAAKKKAVALLRPFTTAPGIDSKLLDSTAADVANNYADGARFKDGRAAATTLARDGVLINKLIADLGKSKITGAARAARLDALSLLLMAERLSTEASIDDLQTSLGKMSPGGPGSAGLSGAIPARVLLNLALARETDALNALKAGNAEAAQSARLTGVTIALNGLKVLGVSYTGDKDLDGVDNLIELPLGSSPLRTDSDGDGLKDNFEILKGQPFHQTSLRDSDKNAKPDGDEDVDGDGRTALQEQADGSDPLSPDYKPGAAIPAATGVAGVKVTIDTGANDKVDINDLSSVADLNDAPGQLTPAFDLYLQAGTTQFQHATVEVPYTAAMLGDGNAADLRLMRFDTSIQFWRPATTNQAIDTQNQVARATIDHFSIYALFNIKNWGESWTGVTSCKPRTDGTDVVLIDLALVLDSSGSMASNDREGFRKSASKAFVDSLLPQDQVAVVDFDSSARVLQPLTSDKDLAKTAIDQIDENGGTNIGAGVSAGIDVLGSGPAGERTKVMVLLTDGVGSYDSSLTATAGAAGITIYTIGLGSEVDAALLTAIATGTGGTYHAVATAADLPQVFRTISQETGDTSKDTDGDGVTDCTEIDGVLDWTGKRYTSDPRLIDTDSDGLTDAEELGTRMEKSTLELFGLPTDESIVYYAVNSDPRVAGGGVGFVDVGTGGPSRFEDSDFDGLTDEEEWIHGTNPNNRDTDGDSYYDGYEIDFAENGFNPIVFDNVMSKWLYAGHFAMGAACGTGCERDTVAWLAGNLTIGVGSSAIPVVGWVVGGIADIRDAVFSAIKGDYVSSGFAAAGVLPYIGDTAEVTGKISRFSSKYSHRVTEVGAIVAKLPVPKSVKIAIAKTLWRSGTWDTLKNAGIDESKLLELWFKKFNIGTAADIVRKGQAQTVTALETPISALMHMWREPNGLIKQNGGKRHAVDFGINEPTPKVAYTTALSEAVKAHVNNPGTLRIVGKYDGNPAILNFNPSTELVVIQKTTGELVSGWKLFDNQVEDVLFMAELW